MRPSLRLNPMPPNAESQCVPSLDSCEKEEDALRNASPANPESQLPHRAQSSADQKGCKAEENSPLHLIYGRPGQHGRSEYSAVKRSKRRRDSSKTYRPISKELSPKTFHYFDFLQPKKTKRAKTLKIDGYLPEKSKPIQPQRKMQRSQSISKSKPTDKSAPRDRPQ